MSNLELIVYERQHYTKSALGGSFDISGHLLCTFNMSVLDFGYSFSELSFWSFCLRLYLDVYSVHFHFLGCFSCFIFMRTCRHLITWCNMMWAFVVIPVCKHTVISKQVFITVGVCHIAWPCCGCNVSVVLPAFAVASSVSCCGASSVLNCSIAVAVWYYVTGCGWNWTFGIKSNMVQQLTLNSV